MEGQEDVAFTCRPGRLDSGGALIREMPDSMCALAERHHPRSPYRIPAALIACSMAVGVRTSSKCASPDQRLSAYLLKRDFVKKLSRRIYEFMREQSC